MFATHFLIRFAARLNCYQILDFKISVHGRSEGETFSRAGIRRSGGDAVASLTDDNAADGVDSGCLIHRNFRKAVLDVTV